MAKTAQEYVNDAKNQLSGIYEGYKNQATTNYNNQNAAYDQQHKDTGLGFDKAKEQNVSQGKMNQNQYNNNTLSRGLGRSSIATTGLAGIQNTTNKNAANLDVQRENELNKITTLKNQLTETYNNNLMGFDKELESKANQLAQELKRYDDDMAYRDWQKQQAELDRKFKEQQAAVEQDRWNQEMAWKKQQAQWERDQAAARAQASYRNSSSSSNKNGYDDPWKPSPDRDWVYTSNQYDSPIGPMPAPAQKAPAPSKKPSSSSNKNNNSSGGWFNKIFGMPFTNRVNSYYGR